MKRSFFSHREHRGHRGETNSCSPDVNPQQASARAQQFPDCAALHPGYGGFLRVYVVFRSAASFSVRFVTSVAKSAWRQFWGAA